MKDEDDKNEKINIDEYIKINKTLNIRKYRREYYFKNKEKLKDYQRNYYTKNRQYLSHSRPNKIYKHYELNPLNNSK